ncbi:MAG: adenylate/guanylate cyclase domain-containing protein [Acidimicrobiia bacterium]
MAGRRQSWLSRLPGWAGRLATIGVLPDDSEDDRLRKASLTLLVALIVALSVVWVTTYAVLELYLSAAIPLAYQVVSILSLIALARTKNFPFFRTSQLVIMLALPALLHWSLGGFAASSGVLLWSLVPALGALVLVDRPIVWFGAYLASVVMLGVTEPFLTPASIPVAVNVVFFVLNIAAVSGTVYFLLRYFMRGFALEREKSDRLLLNVLPPTIARRLKAGEEPIADRFEDVAVLFADVVDFTQLSERSEPEAVVELLDGLFSEFDALIDSSGLEKIKTIGDAYMAVAGLPEPRPDAAEAAAEVALEMQDLASRRTTLSDSPLRLRIGIDVGAVVAGVIGKQKFIYDLWGDVVNTASRMESHGVPGRIQVTPQVFERLRDRFVFEAREPIEVKGKGEMRPYLLVGRRTDMDVVVESSLSFSGENGAGTEV